jgi:serine/threonine-protein kinase HipA
MSELVTLLGDDVIGAVRRDRNGRLSFVYDDAWRGRRGALPLSLSLPLAAKEHPHAPVDAFLWGLLPDNERVLDRWAQQFHVSARSAFALLAHVGGDCAGAVRFALPEHLADLQKEGRGTVEWMDEKDIEARLQALRADHVSWRAPEDEGQFSLAGAQPKTALFFDGKRWGVPSGRVPTTHILKPGAPGLDGHAENEHFCLTLAGELGLPVATSHVEHFGNEVAIVVERYDRLRSGRQVARVHQEDVCQALAIHPARKYENEGGPGATAIVGLLRDYSSNAAEDIATFVESLAYNWLVAGTDGHAKNYSLLLAGGGRARLAPLYDVASALPYHAPELRKLKLAMKIGGKYRVRDIGGAEWRKLAADLRLPEDDVLARVQRIVTEAPDLAKTVRARLRKAGLRHAILASLSDRIAARAHRCATL